MVTGQNKRFFLKFNPALQSDVGIYKVVAKNKVGQSVARMRLVHATVPLSPDPPETVQISENEILLRWKHDNRDVFTPTICYSLQYKETGNDANLEFISLLFIVNCSCVILILKINVITITREFRVDHRCKKY